MQRMRRGLQCLRCVRSGNLERGALMAPCYGLPRTRVSRLWRLVGLFALVASSASIEGRADVVSLDWDVNDHFERAVALAPGKFVELCGNLTRGQAITWKFEADHPLLFNVHFHAGPQVVYPEKREATNRASGTLRVESDQDYCWMWTNKSGQSSTLRLSLNR